jgi:hypothetical protein
MRGALLGRLLTGASKAPPATTRVGCERSAMPAAERERTVRLGNLFGIASANPDANYAVRLTASRRASARAGFNAEHPGGRGHRVQKTV